MTIHLRSVSLARPMRQPDEFPFNVPIIRTLSEIEFTAPVTFLVGENGSGKSTFLEAIAAAAGSIAVGSEEISQDRTLAKLRALAKTLKLIWSARKRNGFFLRSEDFFGYVKRMAAIREEMQAELEKVDEEYKDRPVARGLASLPYNRELYDMQQRYGPDLDSYSHGESYFKLFRSRFVPNGLFLLDEPEAPLSPNRQIVLLAMIREMVMQNGQFIIATHSPILLAYPDAQILQFRDGEIRQAAYDELEHVYVTRMFLSDPASYLNRFFADDGQGQIETK